MTIRLYDKDVDMLDFSAVVKTCMQRENGYVVTLDQTAFFPEGGGQGAGKNSFHVHYSFSFRDQEFHRLSALQKHLCAGYVGIILCQTEKCNMK